MACKKSSKLWKETDKVYKKWANSKTLERWGFTNDKQVFKDLFEASTGKVFLAGENITPKDMKKFSLAIDVLQTDLKSPGILSNKIMRNLYVGSAASMRNPITKDFYNTLTNANEFRNSNNSAMTSSYNNLIKSLKEAIVDFEGKESSLISIV